MALNTTPGDAAADSWATLAEYQAYAASFGWTLSGNDADDEVNLRRAAVSLGASYVWLGYRSFETQALEHPRVYSQAIEGYYFDEDEIPAKIKRAQMELAFLIQGGANPTATLSSGTVKRKREKVDVIEEETEYMDGQAREREAYPYIDSLVAPFTQGKVGARSGSVALSRG